MFKAILENTRRITPLVHSITNYVTVNDCANIILAAGGSPIMADDINEVEEIAALCHVLSINMGTLNKSTLPAMIMAGKQANRINHPVVLDPVAAGASDWRNKGVASLLENVRFSVIRGNISEMKAVYYGTAKTQGVDANADDLVTEENLDKNIAFAKDLSRTTGAVIAISGPIDIVANSEKAYIIRNGHELMSKITGSGCMLTTVIAAYCGANPDNILDSTAAAVVTMGLSGEIAHAKIVAENSGLSSFRMHLIDAMGMLTPEAAEAGAKIEIR